uniref:DUF1275 domain-containing protein n=1 Tax=Psychrobacter sp. (strain PRwf-1) TaxID=349106 RepID=A5WHU9_PSYWF
MSNQNIDDRKDESNKIEKPKSTGGGFWKRFEAAILLTLVGGAIDTIGFIALLGFFTNHVTGNLVMAGGGLVKGGDDLWIKLGALPVFIITVMFTQRYITRRSADKPILSELLFAEVLFLTAFMVSALMFGPFEDPGAIDLAITGFLGLMAFAIRNTAGKTVMGKVRPTLLMTGNTTQLGIDLSDYFFNRNRCNMESLKHSAAIVFFFAFGALIGTLLYMKIGFWSIAPFILPVFYLAFKSLDEQYLVQQNMSAKS